VGNRVPIVVIVCCLEFGCGRIHFDPLGGAAGDGMTDDGLTGDSQQVPSCSGLAATCGPSGISPCCDSSLVAGGMFYRSFDVGTDGAFIDMTNPATVSDFRLDTYEVTVGRFRKFVDAGKGTGQDPPPAGAGARTLEGVPNQGGWDSSWNQALTTDPVAFAAALKCDAMHQTWTDAVGSNESLPILCITWYEAAAFCAWDGGFLPTEAEWNYAAAGGSEQRAYPWSSPPTAIAIDCSYANYTSSTGPCLNPPNGAINRVGSESPKGDGKWGQADLGGNVHELTLDWYAASYRKPCTDCADLTVATNRTMRGGGIFGVQVFLRAADRGFISPANRSGDIGVRCARQAP